MNNEDVLTKGKQSEIPETDSEKNKIITFNNPEFGAVRTIEVDGEPWWVLKDVCDVLEIKNHLDIQRLNQDEVGSFETAHPQNPEKTIQMTYINEYGLYSVILRSDKPKAKPFFRWLTHEVLPSIRKTGSYSVNGRTEMDKELEFMAMAVKMREAEYKVIEARNNNAEVFMHLADTAYRRDDKRFYQSMACNSAAGCNVMPIFGKIRSDIRTRYTVGDLSVEFECTKDFIKFLIDKLGLDSADFAICYPSDDGDKSKDFYVYNYDAYLVIREYFKAYGKDRLERILIEHRISDLLPDKSPMGTSLFSVN